MGDTMEEESFLPNHLMVWKNILPSLDAAAAELSLGDLLHLEHFSLHESMSALEMMDAQMDSGLAASQAADIPPTPPPTAPLEPSALIGTLDELVCAEQAWLNGQPLAQTVFRLEWMHAPLEVGDPTLRACLLAVAKTASAVRTLVLRADVSDEEDFSGSSYGCALQEGLSDADAVAQLKTAEEAVQAAIAEAKAAADGGADGAAERRSALDAVLCRVRYRRAMLSSWQLLRPGGPPTPLHGGGSAWDTPAADVAATPEAAAALKARASEVAKAEKMLAFAQTQLGEMRKSEGLGAPRADVGDAFGGVRSKSLAGSGPSKKAELPPRDSSLALAEARVGRLRTVCAAADVSSFDDLQRWLREVRGSAAVPGPDVVVRALCQLLGVGHERRSEALRPPFPPMVWESVREEAGVPHELWRELAPLAPCSELLKQLAQGSYIRLRLNNVNRGRERRRLRHFLIDWSPLQELGEQLDGQLAEAGWLDPSVQPFGGWALALVAESMCRFLLLGFELELYQPHEMPMVYWYIDSLCALRCQLHTAVADAATAVFAKPPDKKVANKKKSKPAKPPVVGANGSRQQLALVHALRELCRGLIMLLRYADRAGVGGIAPPPHAEFTPPPRRFERRFHVFGYVRKPAPLTYTHYARVVDQLGGMEMSDLLKGASGCFKAAKAAVDKALHQPVAPLKDGEKAELTALARVAVANAVCVGSLQQAPPSAGAKLTFSWAAHAHFPCVAFK